MALGGPPRSYEKSYRRDYFHTSAWKGNSQKLDFRVIRYARMVLSTVSSGQGRPPCRCDEGCVSLPDQSPHRCRNLPTVHPGQRIAETV